ncbi:MAG: DUF6265 family protein [Gemmatimonadota bacterium]
MKVKRASLLFVCLVASAVIVPSPGLGQQVSDPQRPSLQDASWLAGCWEASDGRTVTQENWMEPLGGIMLGMNRVVKDERIQGYEFLKLKAFDSDLVYEAHPSGQPPAQFLSTEVQEDMIRFENPEHDFPRRITYVRDGTDSLEARVDDGRDGEGFALRFQRVECP